MELIDIGVNLASQQFRGDLPAVIQRAREANVVGMVITGTSLGVSERARAIARGEHDLWSTAGVHPHDAKGWSEETAGRLRDMASMQRVVAIGECGLDFHRNYSPPEAQRAAFAEQLALAIEIGLPLFLHQRDAHDDFFAMLREAWPDLQRGAVVHCFTDGPGEAEEYLELGCHLGITGWVTDRRRGDALRQAVPLIPDDRLLLETDAPYLAPREVQKATGSRRNEPMHLPCVAQAVAELRGQTLSEVAESTTANATRFFDLVAQAS